MNSQGLEKIKMGKIVFIINLILSIFLVLEVIPINDYHFVGLKIGIPFNLIWFAVTSFSILNYFKIKWVRYYLFVFVLISPIVFIISCTKNWERYVPANYPYEIHFGSSILIGETPSLVETSVNGLFAKKLLWISNHNGNLEMDDSTKYSIIDAKKADVQFLEDSVKITYYFKDNVLNSKTYKLPNK
jgi:hypothetical protein